MNGWAFDLVTDHKPLLGILAGDQVTSAVLSPLLLRWTIFMVAYNYTWHHHPGKSLGHANALSCCPLPTIVKDLAPSSDTLLIEELPAAPVSTTDVANFTAQDRILQHVRHWMWRVGHKVHWIWNFKRLA